MWKVLRTGGGVVCGYAVMVLLITAVQEGWFGGVGWYESPAGVLLVAGFFTCLAAAIGGSVGTAVSPATGRLVLWIMSGMIVAETTALMLTGRVAGPVWFDILAAASLIGSVLLGGEGWLRYRSRAKARAVP